ncbi:hypothetical protein [Nitrogeniibacter aestuarii]|uniref:hypothetical protein n=1 Tax=Nitrogeniibacter aestuarii TaxID=2815343 RepID=UPI001D123502|nr:hypothetical protein [Nitrogeniibacter aestuarii]
MPLIPRALCLALMLAASGHAMAEEPSSGELRAQAKAIRDDAERAFKVTTYHCYDKFLVNACLDEAKLDRLKQVKVARALEAKASTMDRRKRVKAMEARLRKTEASGDTAPDGTQ